MKPRLIMKLDVIDVSDDRGDVKVITFKHPLRPTLPPFEGGAHVDVHLPDGRRRQYSLCGDPGDVSTYRIAVKLEPGGRGGSSWIHQAISAGTRIPVSSPRNHFVLHEGSAPALLLAGGIGITPMLAMAHQLGARGCPFTLHYFARSRTAAPLLNELARAVPSSQVVYHFRDELAERVDLGSLLADREADAQLYCCGSARFMDEVRGAATQWPDATVHFEAFQPLFDESFVPEPFYIVLPAKKLKITVPADKSALDVLRDNGVLMASSCEIGTCGSCECGYSQGAPIHRDVVLSPKARETRFMPCVSRAVGTLTLEL